VTDNIETITIHYPLPRSGIRRQDIRPWP